MEIFGLILALALFVASVYYLKDISKKHDAKNSSM